MNFIVLHSVPIIINLAPNNILENATQFTNLYIILCHTACCLLSNVVLQRILYLSTVSAFAKYVSCLQDICSVFVVKTVFLRFIFMYMLCSYIF
jgi:hypothetical protein